MGERMGGEYGCAVAKLQVSEVSSGQQGSDGYVRILCFYQCPRQDSNLRSRLRRPLLSPLSYGGSGLRKVTSPGGCAGRPEVARAARTGARLPPVSATARPAGRALRPSQAGHPGPYPAFPARAVAGSAGKTLPSRPWRRDWDACSWWTTMR